jgi:hypothetical protein
MEFGIEWCFADTQNVSTWISQWWNAFVSESARACQYNFESFPAIYPRHKVSDLVRPLHNVMQQRAPAVGAKSVRNRSSSPVGDRENAGSGERSMVSVPAWDEVSVIAQASP